VIFAISYKDFLKNGNILMKNEKNSLLPGE